MQLEIKAYNGQSIYDLCLMSYGTLNKMGQFCHENNIGDINYLPKSGERFIYQSEDIFNQRLEGIKQATAYLPDSLVSDNTYFNYPFDITF